MIKRDDLVELSLEQDGLWCYVWGGRGQDMTAMTETERNNWIDRRESDAKNRERVKNRYETLVKKGVELIRGADCSGFIFWLMNKLGLWQTRRNANGIYENTDRITKSDLIPGDLGFVHNGNKATHVGVYCGNGIFVHSKGRDVGVVAEKSSSNYWNDYGRIREFAEDVKPEEEKDPSVSEKMIVFFGSIRLHIKPEMKSRTKKIAHKGDKLPLIDQGFTDDEMRDWYKVDYKGTELYCRINKYTKMVEV